MSQQVLPSVNIQLTNLVATLSLFVSTNLLRSSHIYWRHAVFCHDITPFLYSALCIAIEEILS